MPKQKTHKGAKKRFRITPKGKVVHRKMNRRHLMGMKKASRRRRLRQPKELSPGHARHIKKLMPHGSK
jgi:large subunit ribosomal protein L35